MTPEQARDPHWVGQMLRDAAEFVDCCDETEFLGLRDHICITVSEERFRECFRGMLVFQDGNELAAGEGGFVVRCRMANPKAATSGQYITLPRRFKKESEGAK